MVNKIGRPLRRRGLLARLGATTLAAALLLSACSDGGGSDDGSGDPGTPGSTSSPGTDGTSDGGAAGGPEGTLVVGVPTLGSETWNFRTSTTDEQQVFDLVAETLVRRHPQTLELEPGLAEEWDLSDDGRTWTFKLREGIEFHDDWGELTTADVEFSWAQNLMEDCSHTRCAVYRNAVDNDMANFEIVDDYEFRIHTPTVQALLPQELAIGQVVMPIFSKAYFESEGEERAVAHPVGTGPYRFVSHTRGSHVEFEALDEHWRQTPAFRQLIMRIVPDDDTRLAQVRSGDLDLAPVGSSQKPEAEAANLNLFSIAGVGTSSIMFGGMYEDHPNRDSDAPWIQDDDPDAGRAIRQAMTLAVNRQAILDNILYGEGELMRSPLSFQPGPDLPWNEASWEIPPYDPARARELLAEGGYPDGFEIDLPIFAQAGRPASEDIAEAVAGMFEAIGITVNRRPMDFQPTFRQGLVDRTLSGNLWQFTAPAYPEPVLGLSAAYMPGGTLAHMNHPALTRNVPLILASPDYDERMRLSREMGGELIADYAAIPVVSVNLLWIGGENVTQWETQTGYGAALNLEYARP